MTTPPPYYGPPQPPYNTYAILALVLSIFVLPPLGIYFGNKAKQEIAVTGERGMELATVAVVLGWVFSAILGLFLILWCGMALLMFGGFFSVLLHPGVAGWLGAAALAA